MRAGNALRMLCTGVVPGFLSRHWMQFLPRWAPGPPETGPCLPAATSMPHVHGGRKRGYLQRLGQVWEAIALWLAPRPPWPAQRCAQRSGCAWQPGGSASAAPAAMQAHAPCLARTAWWGCGGYATLQVWRCGVQFGVLQGRGAREGRQLNGRPRERRVLHLWHHRLATANGTARIESSPGT
jgi:hypothetical protein